MKICVECKHLINQDKTSTGRWYNLLCGASPLEKAQDPVDGIFKVPSANIGNDYQYARSVNLDGTCTLWEAL